MCAICGIPNVLPCNCQSQQPFCDQCADDTKCFQEMDSQCVIYHQNTQVPTKLTCLGMPNGSSVEAILEKIDQFVCSAFNTPLIAVDSPSIDFSQSGNAGHTFTADVNISTQAGNILSILSDGLYATVLNDGKVKVNASTPARYLEEAIIGATDGCVSISAETDDSGLLVLHPTLNIDCLSSLLCNSSAFGVCLANTLCSSDNFVNCIQASLCTNPDFEACVEAIVGPGTSVTADNGLNISAPGNVQLGGTLLHATTIDQASNQLSFLGPYINIGDNAPITATTVNIINSDPTIPNLITSTKNTAFTNSNDTFADSVASRLAGSTFTASVAGAHNAAVGSQLFIGYSGAVALNAAKTTTNSGLYATFVKYNSGSVNGNFLAAGQFVGFGADSGNITDAASILVNGFEAAPPSVGAAYSGTCTNYYGIFVRDINAAGLHASITNKFGVYIEGSEALVVY